MRDWRLNEQIKMDPKLFDILWEVYRQSGSSQPIDVLSGYRSPQTNAMLRRRSRQVAEHSQHMQGKAIDAHFIDVGPGPIRDIAMRMQEGGRRFLPDRLDALGPYRFWDGALLAAHEPRRRWRGYSPTARRSSSPPTASRWKATSEAKAMIESRGGDVQVGELVGRRAVWLAVWRRAWRRRGR